MYRVTESNVTRVWIKWAGRLAIGYMAKFSLFGLRFIPSPGTHVVFHGIVTFRPSSDLSSLSPPSKLLFPLESLTSLLNTAEKSIIRAGHLYEIVLDQIRGSRIHESCTSQRKPAIQQAQRTNDIEIPVIHDSRRGAVSRFCPLLNAI